MIESLIFERYDAMMGTHAAAEDADLDASSADATVPAGDSHTGLAADATATAEGAGRLMA